MKKLNLLILFFLFGAPSYAANLNTRYQCEKIVTDKITGEIFTSVFKSEDKEFKDDSDHLVKLWFGGSPTEPIQFSLCDVESGICSYARGLPLKLLRLTTQNYQANFSCSLWEPLR